MSKINEDQMIESRILKEAVEMEQKTRSIFSNGVFFNGYELNKVQKLKFEESERLISLRTIQKICVKHGLRFLDFQLYPGEMPQFVSKELNRIGDEYGLELQTLRLLAPENYFGLLAKNEENMIILAKVDDGDYLFIQ